jgi:hypothetical protein
MALAGGSDDFVDCVIGMAIWDDDTSGAGCVAVDTQTSLPKRAGTSTGRVLSDFRVGMLCQSDTDVRRVNARDPPAVCNGHGCINGGKV